MARTRRLVPWRQLSCALLATLLATTLCASILRGLVAPVMGLNGLNYGRGVLQISLLPTEAEAASMQSVKALPAVVTEVATETLIARAYLPVSKLSERPLILRDIDPLLTNAQDTATQHLVLQLLINEYGDVDQVLVEDAAVPAELLWQLQQRFLQARFLPGRLQGLAVPSVLRIAVTVQAPL